MWCNNHLWGGFSIFHIAITLVVLLAVYQIFSKRSKCQPNNSNIESALDILKKKYANGEIDQAEFEQKKTDIS